MLQNRVDPFGTFIRTPARGSLMGNRGVIHNDRKEIIRCFKHQAWISCVLSFKDRKRTVMSPNRWTELFFLDEATAFAAGHRPCFECRKEDAKRFKQCWIEGNHHYGFTMKTSINEIDQIIHAERIDKRNQKITYETSPVNLPVGTFITWDSKAYVIRQQHFLHWTPFGYDEIHELPQLPKKVSVLTPRTVVNALAAGYQTQIDDKASDSYQDQKTSTK